LTAFSCHKPDIGISTDMEPLGFLYYINFMSLTRFISLTTVPISGTQSHRDVLVHMKQTVTHLIFWCMVLSWMNMWHQGYLITLR